MRERDIPDLRRRTTHPVLKPAWEELQGLGKTDLARAVEADALRYLLGRDVELGKRAVATAPGGIRIPARCAAALDSLSSPRYE